MLSLLDQYIDLHKRVEIIYTVDGYEAMLVNEDEKILFTAKAATVWDALRDLALMIDKEHQDHADDMTYPE